MNVVEFYKTNQGMLTIDDNPLKFEFGTVIYDNLDGNQLAGFLERQQNGNFLITMNHRWVAVKKKGNFYFCFNSYSTKKDLTADNNNLKPAVIIQAEGSAEAAKVLKLFGIKTNGMFLAYRMRFVSFA